MSWCHRSDNHWQILSTPHGNESSIDQITHPIPCTIFCHDKITPLWNVIPLSWTWLFRCSSLWSTSPRWCWFPSRMPIPLNMGTHVTTNGSCCDVLPVLSTWSYTSSLSILITTGHILFQLRKTRSSCQELRSQISTMPLLLWNQQSLILGLREI